MAQSSVVGRAFKEAAEALGKVSSRAGAALQALGFIAKLYRAESQLTKYREEDPAGFVPARRAQVPVLDTFRGWLQDNAIRCCPAPRSARRSPSRSASGRS